MRKRHTFLVLTILLAGITIGCSGSSAVDPATGGLTAATSTGNSHQLWGLWQFTADPAEQTLEVVPLRASEMHINVLPFLEPPALAFLTLESLEFNGNIIEAGIGLRHPFSGLNEFTGFDVCGVLITNGSVSGFNDTDLIMAGDGDTRLLNPDGLTRWWNPAEFPINTGTIFGYNDGLLGAPDSFADYNCTLNGYKYYCDDLTDPDGSLDAVILENRGMFTAGQKNIRHFTIEIGDDGLIFNYAVDACWAFPSGGPPYQAPDDFSEQASRPEPWRIEPHIVSNKLWNDGSSSGGALSLSIDVYDWYNNEMDLVDLESPGNFTALTDLTPTGGGQGYSTYEVEITSATPAEGQIDILITAKSELLDFDGFVPGANTSAYLLLAVPVDESPGELAAMATAEIEPYFDGFGPIATSDDPIPTEWYLTLDASASTGAIVEYLWEMNGDDLFDDASGMTVSAGFPDTGTHVIKLKVTDGGGGEDIYDLPGSYIVIEGTYVWDAFIETSDGSRDDPWADIPSALADVGGNGCILVRGDDGSGGQCVYDDDLLITGTNAGTRIQGYYGDYDTDEPPMQTGYVRFAGHNLTFDGFEVTGSSCSLYTEGGGNYAKLGSDNVNNALFRHIYIHDIDFYLGYCKAIYAYRGGHLYVENVLEIDLKVSRIKNGAHYLDPEITLTNCTFDQLGNDTSIGAFYRAGSNGCIGWINNCIWTDCGATGFYYLCRTTNNPLYIDYTCTSDTPTPPDGGIYFFQAGPGTGCITDDPLYVDPYSDHHLDTGSPCIDTGDPTITDFDDSPSDMGCYGGPYGDWDFEN